MNKHPLISDVGRTEDGREFTVEQYTAKEQPGAPTGFAGTGWLVRVDGEIVHRNAWRVFALDYVKGL